MKSLRKILLATDFSNSNDNLIKNAIIIAKAFQSEIIIVHVLPDEIKNEKVKELLNESAINKLSEIKNKIKMEDLKINDSILKYGVHFDEIIQLADIVNVNLILIGSGEKTKNDMFQLGSTAERIIRKSNKPVWVIKEGTLQNIKSILCPVDFSDESKRALNSAITLAQKFNAELIVFSVYELADTDSLRYRFDWDEYKNSLRSLHMEEFNSFLEGFDLIDLNFKIETKGGNPAKEILQAIKKHKSDILIMGTTGKSGISKILMGSVTEKVIRELPCTFITLKSEDLTAH